MDSKESISYHNKENTNANNNVKYFLNKKPPFKIERGFLKQLPNLPILELHSKTGNNLASCIFVSTFDDITGNKPS